MAEEVKDGEDGKAGGNAEVCGFCGRPHGKAEACVEQVMQCNLKTVQMEDTVRVGC